MLQGIYFKTGERVYCPTTRVWGTVTRMRGHAVAWDDGTTSERGECRHWSKAFATKAARISDPKDSQECPACGERGTLDDVPLLADDNKSLVYVEKCEACGNEF